MNEKLEQFKKEIKGKKISIIGIGTSNIPAIFYFDKLGANIVARDKNEELLSLHPELNELKNVTYQLGESYLEGLENEDYILRSPGIKPFLKEIEEAQAKGVILTSELELVLALAPCPIIGITGSAGKTTTVTLIGEMLKKSHKKIWVGGNIGTPLLTQVEEMKKEDLVVLELSSFQLMTVKQSPNISLITNIYEDHLDYHRSFEEYVMAKVNIFTHQKEGDICILNEDDSFYERFLKLKEEKAPASKLITFSTKKVPQKGVYLNKDVICTNLSEKEEKIISIHKLHLIGEKNYANVCSAICAVYPFVDVESIQETLENFKGVEHRLEFVAQKEGVKYYNDSISTTPGKAMAAFTSFSQKIILIAGGSDKNLDYTPVGEAMNRCAKILILLGNTKEKIKEAVIHARNYDKALLEIYEVTSMEEAVMLAHKLAKEKDIVVMSPASASFDLYANYKERGKHFKSLVEKLPEEK